MAGKITFSLISPERVLATRSADMVTLPGSEGMLGILPEHAPLITALAPGVVTIEGGEEAAGTAIGIERIFVTGGFAEVTPDKLTVLADDAVKLDELNADTLAADAARLKAELQAGGDAAALQQALTIVEAKLSALAA